MDKNDKKLPHYLFVGRAGDLKDKKDALVYRALEIMPGFLIWTTFIFVIVLSYFKPIWMSVLILAFAFFWLLKSIYFSIFTRTAYKRMLWYEKVDWLQKLEKLPKNEYTANVDDWQDVWQLVIIPMYKESYKVLSSTFDSLLKNDWPKEKMIIVLGTEERGGDESLKVANRIKDEYGEKFGHFLITRHPKDIPGELAGKGSNETWSARRAKEEIIDKENIPYESILVTTIDSDTLVYPRYFSCLAYHFLTSENPYRASYQPIPLFINNIWEAPAISRVSAFSSTFWHTMNQERPEKKVTFSSHSMTFKALVEVGFWQTNVVSEDSRIFWQCFLRFDGNYRVVSLFYPIAMDANVAPSYIRTMRNVYKQQRRWAYGAADIAYFIFGFWKNKKIPFTKKLSYGFNTAEGFYSWATNALLLFVMGWLPLLLGGDQFNTTLFSYNLLRVVRFLLTIAMIGLVSSAYLGVLLLPPRPPNYGKHKYPVMALQWVLVLITLIFFGAIPSIEAQTRLMLGKYMGFWSTPKHRKSKITSRDPSIVSE